MNDIRHSVEKELADLLGLVVDDVAVLPGRASDDRPPEYVCVIAEKSEAKDSNGLAFLVDVSVISVVPADDGDATERSKRRFRQVCDFFRAPGCLFASAFDDITVHGFCVLGQEDATKERSHGDILKLRAGVSVAS
jgi:hypothetical protein